MFGWECEGKFCTYFPVNPPIMTLLDPSDSQKSARIFEYEFSQDMVDYEINANHLDIYVTGPSAPYSIGWSSSWKSTTLLEIKYEVDPMLLGDNDEQMFISVINPTVFESSDSKYYVDIDGDDDGGGSISFPNALD